MPHTHECPLCDSKYSCSDLGCEEMPINICEECMKGIDEVPAEEVVH